MGRKEDVIGDVFRLRSKNSFGGFGRGGLAVRHLT